MNASLVPGYKFRHKDGGFTVEVKEVDEDHNKIYCHVCGCETWSVPWGEDWNLAHTINGFRDGTYLPLEEDYE